MVVLALVLELVLALVLVLVLDSIWHCQSPLIDNTTRARMLLGWTNSYGSGSGR